MPILGLLHFLQAFQDQKEANSLQAMSILFIFFPTPLLFLWQKAGVCRIVSVVLSVLQVFRPRCQAGGMGTGQVEKSKNLRSPQRV